MPSDDRLKAYKNRGRDNEVGLKLKSLRQESHDR